MFGFFQKKVNHAELALVLAMRLHDEMGETEDLAREKFGKIDLPLDGYGFDAAMQQVRFAQITGLCLALGKVVDVAGLLKKTRAAVMEACREVGYLRDGEEELYPGHAELYSRVLAQLGTDDWQRDCAVLGIQFSDFLVANRDPALIELGSILFTQSDQYVVDALQRRKVV